MIPFGLDLWIVGKTDKTVYLAFRVFHLYSAKSTELPEVRLSTKFSVGS